MLENNSISRVRGVFLVTIDIFGSCVSRDAFGADEDTRFKLGNYFARSSVISAYSKAIPVQMQDIKLPSAFQKRMVFYDLTKEFKQYIKKPTSDYLIIDLIDERIRVVKYKNTFITRSREFVNSKLPYRGTIISDEERAALWREKAKFFINDLKSHRNPEKIILHKAFWQTSYKGKDGLIHDFEDPEIEKNNKILHEYYQFIEENIPGVNIIQLNNYISDENHIWGLSPFHYEDNYYIEFINQLNKIATNS